MNGINDDAILSYCAQIFTEQHAYYTFLIHYAKTTTRIWEKLFLIKLTRIISSPDVPRVILY